MLVPYFCLQISKNPITFEGPIMALEIVNNYPDCSLELLEFKVNVVV